MKVDYLKFLIAEEIEHFMAINFVKLFKYERKIVFKLGKKKKRKIC